MNKKAIIIAIVAIVVIAAAVGVYLIFSGSDYSLYSKAFDKTFKADSLELDTTVNAVVDGGSNIAATGNFKLKDMNSESPQFINTMTFDDQTITQFSDGRYIYTDDGRNKNKISLGDEPTPMQNKESNAGFSIDAYISEFSGMLDASMIKKLNALEAVDEKLVDKIESSSVSGGKKFIVTLLPQAVDEMMDTFLNDNLSDKSMSPTINLNSIVYTATVVSDYISEIAFSLDMNVTAPGEQTASRVTVDLSFKPVNAGQQISFSLPSTDGF